MMTAFGFLVHVVLLITFGYSVRYYFNLGRNDRRENRSVVIVWFNFMFSFIALLCFIVFSHSLITQLIWGK